MVDDKLDVGKAFGILRQVRNPSRAIDEHWQAVFVGGSQQPVVSAVLEHRALGRGEDQCAQRLEPRRGGQRFNPVFDAGVGRVHPHQEGEPIGMTKSGRFGVWSNAAKGAAGQAITGKQRSILGHSFELVEQHGLDPQGIHDRDCDLGAEHVRMDLRVDNIHGSSGFSASDGFRCPRPYQAPKLRQRNRRRQSGFRCHCG
jgi:hypothetical protein